MTCSILRPHDDQSTTRQTQTCRTGTIAVLAKQARHPGLAREDEPPAHWEYLKRGELVTVFAQVTDITGGHRVSLDDGSGPLEIVATPAQIADFRTMLAHRLPASLIASFSDPAGDDGALLCRLLQDRRSAPQLIPAGEASAMLDLPFSNLDRTMRGEDDDGDDRPPFEDEIEWVTRRKSRTSREQRVRVTIVAGEDGEMVAAERLVYGSPVGSGGRHLWIGIEDPAERAAVLAEAALRLYARRARQDRAVAWPPPTITGGAVPSEILLDDIARKDRP